SKLRATRSPATAGVAPLPMPVLSERALSANFLPVARSQSNRSETAFRSGTPVSAERSPSVVNTTCPPLPLTKARLAAELPFAQCVKNAGDALSTDTANCKPDDGGLVMVVASVNQATTLPSALTP